MFEIKEFHINNFPNKLIFVYLEENFHNLLFSKISQYKFKDFNEIFFKGTLSIHTFKLWKNKQSSIRGRIKKHFIPLWFILKISEIFKEFPISEIENKIISYKGPSSSAVITNPKLPLVEDAKLMRLVAHLLGDGHAGGGAGTKLPKGKSHSEYRNFRKELLDSFENDLKVFGEVPITKNYSRGSLIFPNAISYMLKHLYGVNFDTFSSKIPDRIFKLSREQVAQFIKAFADDEGHVYDSNIELYSANRLLIDGLSKLLSIKFPEIKISSIKENKKLRIGIKYSLSIYVDSLKTYLNLIGFDSIDKRRDIIYNINRINAHRPNLSWLGRSNPSKIINLLKDKTMSAKEISRLLGIRHSSAIDLLNSLNAKNKVSIAGKAARGTNIWKLNDMKF